MGWFRVLSFLAADSVSRVSVCAPESRVTVRATLEPVHPEFNHNLALEEETLVLLQSAAWTYRLISHISRTSVWLQQIR